MNSIAAPTHDVRHPKPGLTHCHGWLACTLALGLAGCASAPPRPVSPDETSSVSRAVELLRESQFRPLTPLVPPPIAEWLGEYTSAELTPEQLEQLELIAPDGDLYLDRTLSVLAGVIHYERRRETNPDPRLDYQLYRHVALLAEAAGIAFFQQVVLENGELPEELFQAAEELFFRAPEVAALAGENMRSGLGQLLQHARTRRRLAHASNAMGKISDCRLAQSLWVQVESHPGDSPSENGFQEQLALLNYANLQLDPTPGESSDASVRRAYRYAQNALAGSDPDVRRFYHGAALYEAGCEREARAIRDAIHRPALATMADVVQGGFLSTDSYETLSGVDRTGLSRELRHDLGRLTLMSAAVALPNWLQDQGVEGIVRTLQEQSERLAEAVQDYGEMEADEEAILEAVWRVFRLQDQGADLSVLLETARQECTAVRTQHPDSPLAWGAAMSVAGLALLSGADREALFGELSGAAPPQEETTLFNYAFLLTRLDPAAASALFDSWPTSQLQRSDKLVAFHQALQTMLGEPSANWSDVLRSYRAVEDRDVDTRNNLFVAAVLAGDCEGAKEILDARDADLWSEVPFRFNSAAATTICSDPPAELSLHEENFEHLVSAVEGESAGLVAELNRWRAWTLLQGAQGQPGRINEARELVCGSESEPEQIAGDTALVVIDGEFRFGLATDEERPRLDLVFRMTPYLALRAPADALPSCP